MFPEPKEQQRHYVSFVCSLCNIAAQTRPIEFGGVKDISDLVNYGENADEGDTMTDCISKHTPVTQHVMMD